jgi:hypothetical protein
MSISPPSFDVLLEGRLGYRREGEDRMRCLSIYTSRETGEPPSQQHMEDMGRLLAKECLAVAGEGECEIRQIFEGPDPS